MRDNFLEEYGNRTHIRRIKELVGVSGTPTTIASFAQGLKVYVPEKIQNFVLDRNTVDETLSLLASMTDGERKDFSGEFAPRADIIVYGGCILSAFTEYYGIEKITVSDRDSLEGYLEYKLTNKI